MVLYCVSPTFRGKTEKLRLGLVGPTHRSDDKCVTGHCPLQKMRAMTERDMQGTRVIIQPIIHYDFPLEQSMSARSTKRVPHECCFGLKVRHCLQFIDTARCRYLFFVDVFFRMRAVQSRRVSIPVHPTMKKMDGITGCFMECLLHEIQKHSYRYVQMVHGIIEFVPRVTHRKVFCSLDTIAEHTVDLSMSVFRATTHPL